MIKAEVSGVETTRLADSLRQEAMLLLKRAQGLDGLNPYVVTHSHEWGASTYLCWSDHEPTQTEACQVLDSDFDPYIGEELSIEDPLTLEEITGVSIASRLIAHEPEITAPKVNC